jgi:hypothetical protein
MATDLIKLGHPPRLQSGPTAVHGQHDSYSDLNSCPAESRGLAAEGVVKESRGEIVAQCAANATRSPVDLGSGR